MFDTTYIQQLINDGATAEISYRNLHPRIIINSKSKNESIVVPYLSLTNKYKDFIEPFVLELPLTQEEEIIYKFKPKLLSLDLYGTTELWASLMEINNILSVIDFKPSKIRVFDPAKITEILNEILIMEGILK